MADKGYLKKKLFEILYKNGLKLITGLKKDMENKLMLIRDKILLRKRTIIETVFDSLKNNFDLEHTRHRSIPNAFTHIITTLLAYCCKKNKPAIKFNNLIPN